MSEVKRYDGRVGHVADGNYVSYKDYAELKAQRDALEENEGYKQAFYEMAEILGIGARADSPKNVFEQVIKPALIDLQNKRNALTAEVYNCRGFVADHLGPEAELQFSGLDKDVAESILNSVRADAIANALDASSNHCDTDCVMDACDCSYEIAEMRSAGAIALHDGLVAYANELRAGKDGE